MALATLLLLAAAQLASAHFGVIYPEWRAKTLGGGTNYSQWIYPCAGVPPNAPRSNRTDWPLTGGSLKLDLHHPWTYVFVNLGLGDNVTNFNYTLTPDLLNSTGNGTLCIPMINLPVGLSVTDGTKASLQVVTSGDSGSALYNCADITFKASATVLNASDCANSPGVSYYVVGAASGSSNGSSNTTGGSSGKSAGSMVGVNMVAMTSVFVLALAFVFGIGA